MQDNYPTVFILAGGLGTRISKSYPDVPKYLVPVNGEPFAFHQLRLLKKMGFHDVVLCVGYKQDMIKKSLSQGEEFGLRISYSEEVDELLGTGGAIKKAIQSISSQSIPFAVLYGDSYLNFEFNPVFEFFLNSEKEGLMTVYRNKNKFDKSNVIFKNNNITCFDKKNQTAEMEYIDYGFSLYMPSVFDAFDEKSFDLSDVVQKLIASKSLAGFEINQRFYEIGTIEGKRDFENALLLAGNHQ